MRRCAEYFLVLGAKLQGGELVESGNLFKPAVVDYYPPSFAETSFIRDLPIFCYPGGLAARSTQEEPRFYTMGLTDDKGRLYAHCFYFDEEFSEKRVETPRAASVGTAEGKSILSKSTTLSMGELPDLHLEKRVYISRCMCILSRAPLFNTFKAYLTSLFRACQRGASPAPLEFYLTQLIHHTPMPPFGVVLAIPVCGDELLIRSSPLPRWNLFDSLLGSCRDGRSKLLLSGELNSNFQLHFMPLFQALDFDHIGTLLAAILTERKVLFLSSSYALLSSAAEAISGLIWPLQFPHTYIPVVPSSLVECVEAPTPYLMGIHSSCDHKLPALEDVLVVDLDNNRLRLPVEAPPPLPAGPLETLRRRVWPHLNAELAKLDYVSSTSSMHHSVSARLEQQLQIQSAYLHFIFEVHTSVASRIDRTSTSLLEPAEYLKQLPGIASDAFLLQFVESQAFRTLLLETEKYREMTESDIAHFSRIICATNPSPRVVSLKLFEFLTARAVEWQPGKFPPLKAENFLPPRPDLLFSEIAGFVHGSEKSAPMLLFRASLAAQAVPAAGAKKDWIPVFSDIEAASNIDGASYSLVDFASRLLSELSDEDLSSVRLCGPFVNAAVARHIKSLQSAEAREEADLSASLNSSNDSWSTSMDDLPYLKLGEDDLRVAKSTFVTFVYRAGVTTDEATGLQLFESLSRLGPKKTTIRSVKVKKFLIALKEVISLQAPVELQPGEGVVHVSDIQLLPTGLKGRALLTTARLLFIAKQTNKIQAEAFYTNIKSVEKFLIRPVIFAPVVPTLQLALYNSATPLVFLLPSERSFVYNYLRELVPAFQVANDLHDGRYKRYVKTSLSNIRLAEAVRGVERRAQVKHLLSGAQLLNEPWLRKIKEAEKLGILNLDRILTGLVSPRVRRDINPLQLSVRVLESILDLFYAYMKMDGSSVDWDGLASCEDLDNYHAMISSLSKVDLRQYSDSERLAFFVNVYNALLLHAYLVHGGFPTSYLEWRYITKSAHYSIGGPAYSLDDILHGILRGNASLVQFSAGERFGPLDPRRECSLKRQDPRVHFLLCYHTASSPGAVVVKPDASVDTLRKAAEEYIRDHVSIVENSNGFVVKLPSLFQWYRADFGNTKEELINYKPAIEDFRDTLIQGTTPFTFYYDWKAAPKPLRSTSATGATPARSPAPNRTLNLYSSYTPGLAPASMITALALPPVPPSPSPIPSSQSLTSIASATAESNLAPPPLLLSSSSNIPSREGSVGSPATRRRITAFEAAMNEAAKEL